jgi:hypothetical protein
MNIDVINFRAHFVQKEAPALFKKGIWGGGADIRNGYVLGLRFKPAPVFHFLGAGLRRPEALHDASRRTCLKRAKSEQTASLRNELSWGVMFGE